MNTSCEWRQSSDDSDTWESSCENHHEWCFNDGNPTTNGVKFCPFCGKTLVEVPHVEPPDEDEEKT